MESDPEAELWDHLETQSDSDDESDHVASNSPWRSHVTNKQQTQSFHLPWQMMTYLLKVPLHSIYV